MLQIVKGKVANSGLVKGRAVIVRSLNDISKIKKGDILVSEKTIPAMVIAMEKCAGIVTDKGGITSHAAIVSRELGITCLVGCKNATKIFKDGDLLIIDSSKCIAKKVSLKEYSSLKQIIQKNTLNTAKQITNDTYSKKYDIISLKDVNLEDFALVGGKSSRLGELYSKFNVPNGFCITSNVFKKLFSKKITNFDKKNNNIDDYSKKIKNLIVNTKLHAKLNKQLIIEFNKLKKPVAVRSSATMEDLEGMSFAGQQDSYLNIKTQEEFIKSVKLCWASLFNTRAIVYRENNKLNHERAFMSILVQEMIKSEKSGVIFSIDPINKNQENIIIESVMGLGEKLVSGTKNPDTYYVSKEDFSVVKKEINQKNPILSNKEVKELAILAKNIELYFNKAQDIEWTISNNKVFLLQSRNITNYNLDDFNRYLNAIENSFMDYSPDEVWPLSAVQIEAYFDVDEAIEMYYIIEKLKGKNIDSIMELFPRQVCMKYSLIHNFIVGLKVANMLGIKKYSKEEIINHLMFFISIMKNKQENDVFDNNSNKIYNKKLIEEQLNKTFIKTNKQNIKQLKRLITISDALVYSLYYDVFISAGLERHGPYDVSKKYGPGTKMIIFDYYDLKPSVIWSNLKNLEYRNLKISLIYKNSKVKINFINRIISDNDFINNVLYFSVESDKKSTINRLIEDFSNLVYNQTKYVSELSDLDKVRKGALIYHYQFRELRNKYLGDWKPKYIETTISKFGDKFIKKFSKPKNRTPKEFRDIYDPRKKM